MVNGQPLFTRDENNRKRRVEEIARELTRRCGEFIRDGKPYDYRLLRLEVVRAHCQKDEDVQRMCSEVEKVRSRGRRQRRARKGRT